MTLLPGIYILQGGGLTVSGNSHLTGTGVMIYNASTGLGDGIDFSGTSTITLSAPTSGAYQGIVFYQNRASKVPVVLGSGVVAVNLTGVVYAPAPRSSRAVREKSRSKATLPKASPEH